MKVIKGIFVDLSQNRKGYMISNKWSPFKIYVSWDVIFFETPKLPKHITVQVDEKIFKSKKNNNNDNESFESVDSGSKNTKGILIEEESRSEGNRKITEENAEELPPKELYWSKRIRKTLARDNDPRYYTYIRKCLKKPRRQYILW